MYFTIEKATNEIVGTSEQDHFKTPMGSIENEYTFISVDEFLKDCKTDEEKIDKVFGNTSLVNDRYFDTIDGKKKYIVEIIWGDWKHDHLFTKELMNVLGYDDNEVLVEEDGSDCYSANHYFEKRTA